MRAFLSDTQRRVAHVNATLDFSPSGDLAAFDAEREARAILSETEPEPQRPDGPHAASPWVALAESLAAFVES